MKGHTSSAVVTLTYSMSWRGCVGAMNCFLKDSTQKSSGVGMPLVPMTKAVRSDGASAGSANATPGVLATAIPTPSATANAPTRPMHFAVPIAVPPSR